MPIGAGELLAKLPLSDRSERRVASARSRREGLPRSVDRAARSGGLPTAAAHGRSIAGTQKTPAQAATAGAAGSRGGGRAPRRPERSMVSRSASSRVWGNARAAPRRSLPSQGAAATPAAHPPPTSCRAPPLTPTTTPAPGRFASCCCSAGRARCGWLSGTPRSARRTAPRSPRRWVLWGLQQLITSVVLHRASAETDHD